MPIDKSTRDNIASWIAQNISFEKILDDIWDNIANNHLERTHFLTKKYLYNIEATYYINHEAVYHSNDATSVGFIRDRSKNRLIMLHIGKISSKVKELRKRHKISRSMSHELVLENDESNSWNVPSRNTNEIYEINKLESNCYCQINCYYCQLCIHSYSFSCIDRGIKWNKCKHIHLVYKYITKHHQTN